MKYLIANIFLISLLISCENKKIYTSKPKINLYSLNRLNKDSAICTINFTDYEGNIYNTNKPNIILKYLEKNNNKWDIVHLNKDTIQFLYTIKKFNINKKNIEASISVTLSPYFLISDQDSFRYKIILIDNKNLSDTIETISYHKKLF